MKHFNTRPNLKKRPAVIILFLLTSATVFAQSSDDQPIAPELVGKWCFMNIAGSTADALTNSCITLNADGTFEAGLDRNSLPNANAIPGLQNSDYGKWWVIGSRLFYNSSANGQGSYSFQKVNHPRLQNTPMIVVNGVAFVTASSHDPW
jgi:hypothetical protein